MNINDPCYCSPALTKLFRAKTVFIAAPHVDRTLIAELSARVRVSSLLRCARHCAIALSARPKILATLRRVLLPAAALTCVLTVTAKLAKFLPPCAFEAKSKFLCAASATRAMRARKIKSRAKMRSLPWKLRAFKPIPMAAQTIKKSRVVVNHVLAALFTIKPKIGPFVAHRTAGVKSDLECVAIFLDAARRIKNCKAELKCSTTVSQEMQLSHNIAITLEFK